MRCLVTIQVNGGFLVDRTCTQANANGVGQCETLAGGHCIFGGLSHTVCQGFSSEDVSLDPTEWCDKRARKRGVSHPAYRHRGSKEALLVDTRWKPTLVDSQPHMLQSRAGTRGSLGRASTSTLGNDASLDRMASYGGNWKLGFWARLGEDVQLNAAVEALESVVQQGSYVDSFLFYRVLRRCIAQKNLVLGRRVHALSRRAGYEFDTFLANHVILMYASHGRLEEAMQVFTHVPAPDVYMWASVILVHARHGQPKLAIKLYREMRQWNVRADNHVFVAVLKACASAADLASGKEVHADILGCGNEPDIFVGNCLVDMYAKCGSLAEARQVFDRLLKRDVVTWNAMVGGYAQHGLAQEALTLYMSMQEQDGTLANRVTFVCLLQACGKVGALHQGKQLHAQLREKGLEADVVVGSCLVDMYATCGTLVEARRVFDRLPVKNVVTWTALLNGYALHSDSQMARQCFEEMQQEGVEPDGTTFICLLVACSHKGLVQEGQQYLRLMMEDHSLSPTVQHYNCMIDLLGRSGHLDEAENMLTTMPFKQDVVAWTSLLSSCKSHGDIERGRRCFDRLTTLEPEDASPYVLMCNIYANAGRWRDVDEIEKLRKCAGAWKKVARACIEVKNEVHEFTVGEERADVSPKLKSMNLRAKQEGGHLPQTELVLKAVSESEKEDALCGHAEKLALAYGLLHTPNGETLLVTKNLRMCNDCHSSTKIISGLEKREIIVRDAHRVHRFLHGCCSCGDRH